jgi:hypothetical protein
MWIHRINGTLIFIFTFCWVLQIIAWFGWSVPYKEPHQLIGIVILSFVGVIVLGGVFTRAMMQRIEWSTAKVKLNKYGHMVKTH